MKERDIITGIIILAIIVCALLLVRYPPTPFFYTPMRSGMYSDTYQSTTIRSYEDCRRAGYQVIVGSNPIVCQTPRGQTYTQGSTTTTTTTSDVTYPQSETTTTVTQ